MDVYLRFDDRLHEKDREMFLKRLNALNAPDFEVMECGAIGLRIDSPDENAALVRAQVVVQALCKAIGIHPDLICRTLDPS